MSLDIAILEKDGTPKKQVVVGLDNHHKLVQLVGQNDGLLKRLNDYYTDAEFQLNELDRLIDELAMLCGRCPNDERFLSFLTAFTELAKQAKREQQSLLAIAD